MNQDPDVVSLRRQMNGLEKQLADEKMMHRGERYRLEQKIANLRSEIRRLLDSRKGRGRGKDNNRGRAAAGNNADAVHSSKSLVRQAPPRRL